jgi:hypothetical protein
MSSLSNFPADMSYEMQSRILEARILAAFLSSVFDDIAAKGGSSFEWGSEALHGAALVCSMIQDMLSEGGDQC